MSVLETFYILFKSDADKAAEGLEKVEDAADGAEAALNKADRATKSTSTSATRAAISAKGVQTGMAGAAVGANSAAAATTKVATATAVADANAKRLATSFMAVAKAAAAPLLGLLSVAGISNIATGRAESIRELDQFSAKLNSTIGDVDAFQRSVMELGGEGTKALDSLVKIGEKVNEAFADSESGARKDFEAWGLAFKDAEGNALGATEAMLALAESVEGVSRAEGLARIKKLGIEDAATIELILKGRKEVERYTQAQKDMGVVTEEQAEITREYYAAMGQLGNRLGTVGNGILSNFLPAITASTEALSAFVQWATDNQTLVEGFFIGLSSAITIWALPALGKLAVATLAALWPWALLALAIVGVGVAFALAYEDFKAWSEGQPSILGELLGDYEAFVEKLRGFLDAFSWDNFLKDLQAIKRWFSDAFSIEGFLKDVETIKAAFSSMGKWVAKTLGAAVQGVIDLIKGIPGAIQAAVVAIPLAAGAAVGGGVVQPDVPAGTDLSNPADAADFLRNGEWAKPQSSLGAGQSMLNGASGAPQGLANPPANVNQTSTVTVGEVNVHTQATDAPGIARAVRGELRNQLASTAAAFDDGVVS